MKSPILFLIYNRPDHTSRVFEAIRKASPDRLFVAADGPRFSKPGDEAACNTTRLIATAVDWPCEVKTLFRDENMGLRNAIPEAIDWFFQHVEEGIILEDDCLPSPGFFRLCSHLLERYRDDERIAHINGSNFLLGKKQPIKSSYYFSNIYHPWGWATWKRSWKLFDGTLMDLDGFISSDRLRNVTENRTWRDSYYGLLTRTKRHEIDTWDYSWYYSLWNNGKLSITPVSNMVTNIGFGSEGTNTNYNHSRLAGMKSHSLARIIDSDDVTVNRQADEFALNVKFNEGKGNLIDRIREKLRLMMNR